MGTKGVAAKALRLSRELGSRHARKGPSLEKFWLQVCLFVVFCGGTRCQKLCQTSGVWASRLDKGDADGT